jgi:hypothetical protein
MWGVTARGFALTADRIYYLHPEKPRGATLRSFAFMNGAITTIASIQKPLAQGLSASPAGKYFLYSQADQNGSDLMLLDGFK